MQTLLLQAIVEGLKTFNLIYADLPVADRRQAWKDWCDFWRPVLAAIRSD